MAVTGSRRKAVSDIVRLVFVILLFAGAAILLSTEYVRDELFDLKHARDRIQGHGWRGYLAFAGIATLVTGFGVPRLWVSAAAGGIFGALAGTVIGHFACLAGATINFYTGRYLLRGPVKRRMPRGMKVWYDRFNDNGFRWLLYLRLFPLSNATVTNLVGGLSHMSIWAFLGATFIGYLPLTLVFAIFGSSAAKRSWTQLLAGVAIFVAVLGAERFYQWRRAKQNAGPDESLESGEKTDCDSATLLENHDRSIGGSPK